MLQMVDEAEAIIASSSHPLEEFGRLLHESWKLKRTLTKNISNASIDEIYDDYFRRVREIAATGLVDCLSHLDLIKIHGHRPCGDVRSIINETLNFIRSPR